MGCGLAEERVLEVRRGCAVSQALASLACQSAPCHRSSRFGRLRSAQCERKSQLVILALRRPRCRMSGQRAGCVKRDKSTSMQHGRRPGACWRMSAHLHYHGSRSSRLRRRSKRRSSATQTWCIPSVWTRDRGGPPSETKSGCRFCATGFCFNGTAMGTSSSIAKYRASATGSNIAMSDLRKLPPVNGFQWPDRWQAAMAQAAISATFPR